MMKERREHVRELSKCFYIYCIYQVVHHVDKNTK